MSGPRELGYRQCPLIIARYYIARIAFLDMGGQLDHISDKVQFIPSYQFQSSETETALGRVKYDGTILCQFAVA